MKSKKVYIIKDQHGKADIYARVKQTKEQKEQNRCGQYCFGCAFDWSTGKCGLDSDVDLHCYNPKIYVKVIRLSDTSFIYNGVIYAISKKIYGEVDSEWWER